MCLNEFNVKLKKPVDFALIVLSPSFSSCPIHVLSTCIFNGSTQNLKIPFSESSTVKSVYLFMQFLNCVNCV